MLPKPRFIDQYTRVDELLIENTAALGNLVDILQAKGDVTKKPLFLTYPSSGSTLTTITKGVTTLNFEEGTVTDVDGVVSNMRQSLQGKGFEWARSFFVQSDTLLSVQIDDNDPLLASEERDAYGIHQQFKRIKLIAYEDTEVFVIISTSPDALIQIVSNIFVMKGLGASGYPVAVDINGYLTAVIRGDQGTIAQDANNKLISVMQGSQGINVAQQATSGELISVMKGLEGSTLRTITLDSAGNIVAVMKGEKPDTSLDTVALDANGKIISIMQGSTGNAVAQDGNNKLIAIMQGSTGVAISQDAANNLVAVMKGEYAGALETIALDSEQRMIARTLMSIDDVIRDYQTASASGVNESLNSSTVGAGKLWCITSVLVANISNWTDNITLQVGPPGSYINFHVEKDIPAAHYIEWHGEIWLEITEKIHALFTGLTIGDSMRIYTHGYQINAV